MFPVKTVELNPYDANGCYDRETARNEAYKATEGLHRIGGGVYAQAFSNDATPFVVKIGQMADHGYLSYLEVISELGIENPYLPRIIDVTFYKQKGAEFEYLNYYVVRMEKLVKGDFHYAWSTEGGTVFEHQCRFIRVIADVGLPPWPIDPQMIEAVTIVHLAYERASTKKLPNYDLHCQNFLLRGDQLVITDPIA